jgi:circadian clock protein KaiC
MSSIGFDFEPLMKKGLLKIVSIRPSFFGLEMHLLDLYKIIADFKPKAVVIDPLTSLIGQGNQLEIRSMLTRLIDALKSKGITGFFTSLVSSTKENDNSGEIGVSSLIDTWIVVRELEENDGKRRVRGLYIVKSRGTNHSSDVHKLILSDDGITLLIMDDDVPASPSQGKKVGKSITEKPKLIKKDHGNITS